MDGAARGATFAASVARPPFRPTHVQPAQHLHALARSQATIRLVLRTTIFAIRSAPRGFKSLVGDWLREITSLMWMRQALGTAFPNAPRTRHALPLHSIRAKAQPAVCLGVIKARLPATRLVESKAMLTSAPLVVPR